MKIAINTRLLLKNQMEGIGWYTHELMSRLVRNHPEHEFYFIFDRPFDKSFIYAENVLPVIVSPPARHVFLYYLWFDLTLKWALKKIKPDLFFSPDSINSLHPVCKTVTTVHDVNFISNPKNFSPLLRWFYHNRTVRIAGTSDKLLTVSEFSKKDMINLLNIPSDKIEVIYNACREGFKPVSEEVKQAIRLKYTQGKTYFVFIGGLYFRKNLVKLVEAFELFKDKSGSDMKLLIVGRKVGEADELLRHAANSSHSKDIILTDRIDEDDEVKKILASAMALTYISVLEGFGMPLVEAMKSEVPIIASRAGSIPEVGGEAVLYVDQKNATDIAEKMIEISQNHALRTALIEKAKIQSKKFDWDESAKKLWTVFEQVINEE